MTMRSRAQTIAIILSKFRAKHGGSREPILKQATQIRGPRMSTIPLNAAITAAGLPTGFRLDPTDTSLNALFTRGAFDLSAKEGKGAYSRPGERYELTIKPKMLPGIKQLPPPDDDKFGFAKGKYYDSTIATPTVDDQGYARSVLKPGSGYTKELPFKPEPGVIYRGMSHEEYQAAVRQGHFETSGDYNLGEEQKGLTYFAQDPETANSYASSFAPYPFKATFGFPAYMIKIKEPKGSVRLPHIGDNEIGIKGKIKLEDVLDVVEMRPYEVQEGKMDLNDNNWIPATGKQFYVHGSSTGFGSASIGYKSLGPPTPRKRLQKTQAGNLVRALKKRAQKARES